MGPAGQSAVQPTQPDCMSRIHRMSNVARADFVSTVSIDRMRVAIETRELRVQGLAIMPARENRSPLLTDR